MNRPTRASDIQAPKVTVGPIRASTKVYSSPAGQDDVRVPFREIALTDPAEPSFRVYDSSGPYTDPNITIDVAEGLPRIRDAWIAERGGIETYDGREVKPEDNGNVSDSHAARIYPTVHRPHRSSGSNPLTQFEHARAGIITKEMIYVAHRENLVARKRSPAPRKFWPTAKASAPKFRAHHARVRALGNRARPRHHPIEHQPRRTGADDHRPQLPREDQR